MNRIIMMLLLAAISSNVMAEWVRIEENENMTAYVNPSTVRKNGDTVGMRTLFDYKTVQTMNGGFYSSLEGQDEYDCKQNQRRTSYFSMHTANMGGGKIVSTKHPQPNWKPVRPHTFDEYFWIYACSKK